MTWYEVEDLPQKKKILSLQIEEESGNLAVKGHHYF